MIGAFKLNSIGKFTVTATALVIRSKKIITAAGNAQVSTAQSKFGGSSALFDGNGDYLTLPASQLTFGTGNWTIEGWYRASATAGDQYLINFKVPTSQISGIADIDSGNGHWGINIYQGNWRAGAFNNKLVGGVGSGVNTGIDTTTWHHFALVRDSSTTLKYYIDGTQIGSTVTLSSSDNFTPSIAYIGSFYFSTVNTSWNGYLDEIRISSTARYTGNFTAPTAAFVNDSDTMLLIHANGTNASTYFEDDNGQRAQKGITALGNAQISTAQSKFGGASALFDGNGDYLTVSTGADLTDLTVELWYRAATLPGSGLIPLINFNNTLMYIGYNGANTVYDYYANGSGRVSLNTVAISTGVWYHAAFVRSGSNITIYHNGTSVTTGTFATAVDWGTYSAEIAKYSTYFLNGHIDEIRISNSARYTSNFTPSTTRFINDANTVLLMHMQGANGSTVFGDDNGYQTPTSVPQTAVAFDGTGDYYSATGLTTTATDNGRVLIAGTIYWAGGNNLQHVVNLRLGTGGGEYGFWVWINGGRMQCKMVDGVGSNPTSIYENAENSLTANDWNQFVIYWDTASYTTNTKIYVNGISNAISNEGTSAINWNWGNSATTVKIGQLNSSQTGTGADFNGRIAQIYINNPSSDPGIDKFWNHTTGRPYDLGTNGTATGLAQPLIYHYGSTSTFATNNGTGFNSYTLTASGNTVTGNGPDYA